MSDGGERLYEWAFDGKSRGQWRRLRRVHGNRCDRRREPGIDIGQWPLVTYMSDVETAFREAKQAAGDSNVLVHGAATAQLALAAGVLDELEIHLIPVLLGQERRLFDNLAPVHIELQRTRILEGEDGVTHVHYRVQR
jgi:dihydrofolate reductase